MDVKRSRQSVRTV